MKRTFPVFLALLLLAGCGKAKEIDPAVLGPKLLEEAGFPDTMTELAEDMLPVVWPPPRSFCCCGRRARRTPRSSMTSWRSI